jgi:uncharacterized protein YbaP (TraB family)
MIFKFHHKHDPDKAHYIMGTMHTRDLYAYSFQQMAVDLLAQCQTYAPEMNILELSQDNFEISSPYIDHQQIPAKLTGKLRTKLDRFFNITLEGELIYPMNILQQIQEKVVPPVYNLPFDHFLLSVAKSMEMPIIGLESAEQQLSFLNSMNAESLLDQVFKILRNKPAYHRQMNKLALKYQMADISYVTKKSAKSLGKLKSIMLHQRNLHMKQKLIDLAKESIVFASVGAGHLGGDKGMLTLLKRDGYLVQALC